MDMRTEERKRRKRKYGELLVDLGCLEHLDDVGDLALVLLPVLGAHTTNKIKNNTLIVTKKK